MATGKFISYLRVSTVKQGNSGLGLEAQREAIEVYLNGGNWELLKEFVEVESGKNDSRPQLMEALEACQATGATLVIAKLDRLTRDAHFLLGLQKAGVEFVAVDMPEANSFTVGIMALVAQQEREAISERTRAALQRAKARGVKLGTPENLTPEGGARGREQSKSVRMTKADTFAHKRYPRISQLMNEGLSLQAIAKTLNSDGVLTATGKAGSWTARAVKNVLERVKE